jgi:NAD(P)-dependent dehydrogenase (short-subunit alcohol dehydrogenase family)
MTTSPSGQGNGRLQGAVVAVAGAAGPAGRAVLVRLAEAGATVAAADANATRLADAVEAARQARSDAIVTGDTVDLLDLAATRSWAERTAKEFGRIDGLVHLVGGWRGSKGFAETELAHWAVLETLLIRTVQHTSLAFQAPLCSSGRGRYVLVSAAAAAKPTAGNAAYAAAKSAAEAWTLALADSFHAAGQDSEPPAAAVILIVKALVHDAVREEQPQATFAGFTDVKDLAEAIVGVWGQPSQELNGTRLWLTPKP